MALYIVTFEAEVSVQVEAASEDEAEDKAQTAFTHHDVTLLSPLFIDKISGDDDNGKE